MSSTAATQTAEVSALFRLSITQVMKDLEMQMFKVSLSTTPPALFLLISVVMYPQVYTFSSLKFLDLLFSTHVRDQLLFAVLVFSI